MKNITNYHLTIGWLYPELMNIYGDRGNITTLTKRCGWRGIKTEVKYLNPGFSEQEIETCNLLLMGGAQDKQQIIVNKDLMRVKKSLSKKIENETPGLFVCGGFQFLGKYYKDSDGNEIEGLGIFDLYTINPGGNQERLIGNAAFKFEDIDYNLIGFENHGGRTYLGKNVKPFGSVIKGFGNNGEDKSEGAKYKNSFGTYLHGPILPKNPKFADYLIKLALEKKYGNRVELKKLDDFLEEKARSVIAKRLGIEI